MNNKLSHQTAHRVCTQCVMDTSDQFIEFDLDGVCNHCKLFQVKNSNMPLANNGEKQLESIFQKIKDSGREKEYDCILGLSGGVDSSYVALLVKKYKLNPLVIHVDGGWNTELAVFNIQKLVEYLDADLHTHVVNWKEMKSLQRAYLKSGLANQDVPQDHAFFACLYHYASEYNVKYIISGSNVATEGVFPSGWLGDAMDAQCLKAVNLKFGGMKLKTYPLLSFFSYYIYYPFVKRMHTVKPLNYIVYNKKNAVAELEKTIGYKPYARKHGESTFTKFYQNYYLPTKYGLDKRRPHLSSLVLSNQIDRDEALRLLEKPLYVEDDLARDLLFVAKKLDMNVEELKNLTHDPFKTYYEQYPNWISKINVLRKIYKIVVKLGIKPTLKAH